MKIIANAQTEGFITSTIIRTCPAPKNSLPTTDPLHLTPCADHRATEAAVGAALLRTGRIKPGARNPPSTGVVFIGLKSFQRASGPDHDGIIVPCGPTEQLLARNLEDSLPAPSNVGADPTPAPDLTAGQAEDELPLGRASSDRLSDTVGASGDDKNRSEFGPARQDSGGKQPRFKPVPPGP